MIPHNVNPDDDSPNLVFAIALAVVILFPMLIFITDFIVHALALPPHIGQALGITVIIIAMIATPLMIGGLIARGRGE